MKNVIKFLTVVIFMATATMQAQDKPACCAKKAEKKVEMMKEKLSLSNEQVEKITILVSNSSEEFEEQIKEVLTPEQYTKYQEMSKSCSSKKSCSKSGAKKASCKKKSCDKTANKKACCKKDGKKKSCCKKK